ncbi:MAG: hypothetical protein II719_07445 [Clostridia bacterium]|nr:hypothetical protein [Clostridia bacterium]
MNVPPKRCSLFCGHYGSGKTNLAVNYAKWLKRDLGRDTVIADLDIVNPYFRTADSREELERDGISVLTLPYARSNVDLPSIPSEAYSLVQDRTRFTVWDIGGDDRGAYALGRFVPSLREEGDFDLFFVVNFYRPLTRTPEACAEVLSEIEAACGLSFTGILNNSNLGAETTPDAVRATLPLAEALSDRTGLPVVFTSAEESVARGLAGSAEPLFPLRLQKRPTDPDYRF